MQYCCDVMKEEMKAGDAVVDGPEKGNLLFAVQATSAAT
jgi:hypothetical protein